MCHGLLIVHFDLKPEVFDHAPDFGGGRARSRQVAVHEDGVGRVEREGLKGSQIMFAAAGDAEFGSRVQEAEETEDFQTALRRQLVAILERRASDRVQCV